MFYIYFAFTFLAVLSTFVIGNLETDGKLDLGKKWNYEYSVKNVPTIDLDTQFISKNANNKGPQLIDIYIKRDTNDPNFKDIPKIEIANADNKDKAQKKFDISNNTINTNNRNIASTASDAFTIIDLSEKTKEEFKGNQFMTQGFTDALENKTHRKRKGPEINTNVNPIEKPESDIDPTKLKGPPILRFNKDSSDWGKNGKNNKRKLNDRKKSTRSIIVEHFPKEVTSLIDSAGYKTIHIKPELVKDDPKIKDFTKHVYEQTIKVFESLKKKMTNYDMKKEINYLMKSYEDKFGDFVRETQNQRIKTRRGKQKVILNTVDTSNRILERLVNYLIGKMDYKGVLRNGGGANVLQNEIHKKMELEDKHICHKYKICRNREGFATFTTDILNIILSSDDRKVIEARDASTEVLKNTDFGHAMNVDTEKRFRKGINDIEKYDIYIMKPLFFIMKNLIANRNAPIKVVGPEDSRVNKTLAFLDIIDSWEKRLPANESNLLEWNDMKNSFKGWSEGKRKDIKDIVQCYTDHVMKVINGYNNDEAKNFERNINIILGY